MSAAEQRIAHTAVQSPVAMSFDDIYASNQVVVAGEFHTEEAARLSIAAKLPELAAAGGALVMEGIPANRQNLIDEYLAAPEGTPVPELLKGPLHLHTGDEMMFTDNPDYYSAERLLMDAKRAGVPVYTFDSDALLLVNYTATTKPGYTLPVDNPEQYGRENPLDYRLMAMNEQASQVIDGIRDRHPKVIVNVGGSHAIPENGVPGLGDMVGGAQVFFRTGQESSSAVVPAGTQVEKPPEFPFNIQRGDYLVVTANPDELRQTIARQNAEEELHSRQPHQVTTGTGMSDVGRQATAAGTQIGEGGQEQATAVERERM